MMADSRLGQSWTGVAWRVACIVLMVCPAGTAWAFRARIDRPVVEETLGPGSVTNGTMDVENLSEEPLALEIYLQDWEYVDGGSGEKLFTAPGTSPWSAAGWISFYPQQLALPPKGRGALEYTIRVPEEAPAGGRYAVLFFESLLGKPQTGANGVSVQYTGRLGSLIEVQVAGTVRRAGRIAEVTVGDVAPDRPLALGYRFENTGNIVLRPKGFFNIVDAMGRYFGRGEFSQVYTFPGRSGTTTTEWTGQLPPGDYTVLITLDLGQNDVLVAERPLHVGS